MSLNLTITTLTTLNLTLTNPHNAVALLIQYLCCSFKMLLFRSVALLNRSLCNISKVLKKLKLLEQDTFTRR